MAFKDKKRTFKKSTNLGFQVFSDVATERAAAASPSPSNAKPVVTLGPSFTARVTAFPPNIPEGAQVSKNVGMSVETIEHGTPSQIHAIQDNLAILQAQAYIAEGKPKNDVERTIARAAEAAGQLGGFVEKTVDKITDIPGQVIGTGNTALYIVGAILIFAIMNAPQIGRAVGQVV
jgi:hypothetical protein